MILSVHKRVSHPFENCTMLKERIMQLIKDGTIRLGLDYIVETNHISCQTKGLSLIYFRSLEPAIQYEHGLPSCATQEEFFPVSIFDKLAVDMT